MSTKNSDSECLLIEFQAMDYQELGLGGLLNHRRFLEVRLDSEGGKRPASWENIITDRQYMRSASYEAGSMWCPAPVVAVPANEQVQIVPSDKPECLRGDSSSFFDVDCLPAAWCSMGCSLTWRGGNTESFSLRRKI